MFRPPASPASSLWRHRDLLWQFTLRNVEIRHKGSHLGLLWSFLNPLLMLGLYVLVFGYIYGSKFNVRPNETPIDYVIGVFLGLTVFHFVAEVLGLSPAYIVGYPNFVKKVVFPLEILPASGVGGAAFHMLVSLVLALISQLLFGHGIGWSVLWLPVILLPVVLWMLGLAWFFSSLGVFFRDIGQVMQFLSMALMFASAVFYSAQKIPPAAWVYMRFNPVLLTIELARDAALWQRPLNHPHLAYLYFTGLAVSYLGHAAFQRMKPAFADVL
ncbi:MAG: ABC transporter permease [Opitutales bacterium]